MNTLRSYAQQLADGEITSVALTQRYLDRIATANPRLNAYLSVHAEMALAQARVADARRGKQDHVTPLTGIPLSIKDLLHLRGMPTTCASKILEHFRPTYTATAVQRLIDAGAVILGKTNMDEFAMGASNENSAFGAVANPWDVQRVPGGSSGGSAAAVAADLCLGTLGSDTGGSIRQPAAFCGIVGLKPTYGRVSRYGLVAFASSLDQIGPITKDVKDCALLLSVIAGQDPRDSTSAPVEVPDYLASLGQSATGLRFGVPKEYFVEGIDTEVRDALEQAAAMLERLGMRRVEVGLPHTPYAVAAYYIIATAEASSNLARYDGVQYGYRAAADGKGSMLEMYLRTRAEGFGPEAKRRIMLGTYVLSRGYYEAYYLKGLKVRTLITRDFEEAFERCDVILTPTSPTAAFRLGEKLDNPLAMYLSDIYTISVNLAGVPALALPAGFTKAGLPVGMQLIGPPFVEETLFQLGGAYEQATDWHTRKPPL